MIQFYRFGVLLAALLFASFACAAVEKVEGVQVEGAWISAPFPGQDSVMAYMSITSKLDATLVAVTSTSAEAAELHSMSHNNGMMTMEQVDSISLPANKRVELNMHGYHLVLANLKEPLKAGMTVPLTLTIEMADKHRVKVNVKAEVRSLKSHGK